MLKRPTKDYDNRVEDSCNCSSKWDKLPNFENSVPNGSCARWTVSNSEWNRDSTGQGEADRHSNFLARRDHALANIVLAVEPPLLYLNGDPEDPVVVWKNCRINSIGFRPDDRLKETPTEFVVSNVSSKETSR